MIRTTVLILTGALALTACKDATSVASESAPAITSTTEAMMDTKTKAVLIYADWCGSCKVLDPMITPLREAGMPGVEFVTLDYTAKDADAFYAQAEAAGVEAAIRATFGDSVKTGQLLLVDIDDARVVGKVTKTNTPGEIRDLISKAVRES